MLVSHAVIYTNVLKNTKTLHHSLVSKDLTKNFSVLKRCTNKFDCFVCEMFFIHELRPTLNVQSESIRAKVFN